MAVNVDSFERCFSPFFFFFISFKHPFEIWSPYLLSKYQPIRLSCLHRLMIHSKYYLLDYKFWFDGIQSLFCSQLPTEWWHYSEFHLDDSNDLIGLSSTMAITELKCQSNLNKQNLSYVTEIVLQEVLEYFL